MKAKKTEKASLENKRSIFFQIGLITAIGVSLAAFEWSTPELKSMTTGIPLVDIELDYDELPITFHKKRKPLPPPPVSVVFEIVPDIIDIDEPTLNLPDINETSWYDNYNFGNEIEKPVEEDLILINAEEMPMFRNGGLEKFQQYLFTHVNYPEEARDVNLQGTVVVSFVVDKKGNITNIELLRSIDPVLDNEVIQALQSSPRWMPGKQLGIPVNVRMVIPVKFELN